MGQRRSYNLNLESLSSLYGQHPHLLIFQKENWREYVSLLAQIYDLMEEDGRAVKFEVVRGVALQFYSKEPVAHLDQRVSNFFTLAIGELAVLQDSFDSLGERYVNTTRNGKELLTWLESLVQARVKFSGTGAETLLASLNSLLIQRPKMDEAEALEHHQEKIRAYQADIKRIKSLGVQQAQLLPVPHSPEALFQQAEEAARHLSLSIEDVKVAIETQRTALVKSYLQRSGSAGSNVSAVADFFVQLYQTPEYKSYQQAKDLLSFLEAYSARFAHKNVDLILHQAIEREILPKDLVQRSHLKTFREQFTSADEVIGATINAQIQLLEIQVGYALATDVSGQSQVLQELMRLMGAQANQVIPCFTELGCDVLIPIDLPSLGNLRLFDFELGNETIGSTLTDQELSDQDQELFIQALLASEEVTLRKIIEKVEAQIQLAGFLELAAFPWQYGLAEYYVLAESQLYLPELSRIELTPIDLELPLKQETIMLHQVLNFRLERSPHGLQPQ